jgi:hypothetical protein
MLEDIEKSTKDTGKKEISLLFGPIALTAILKNLLSRLHRNGP